MEEFKNNKTKKLNSEGADWSRRRVGAQAEEAVNSKLNVHSVQDIFGHQILSSYDIINRRGPLWEAAEKQGKSATDALLNKVDGEFGGFNFSVTMINSWISSMVRDRNEALVKFARESFAVATPLEIARMMGLEKEFKITGDEEKDLMALVARKYTEGWNMPVPALIFLLENHRNAVLEAEKRIIEDIRIITPKIRQILMDSFLAGNLPIPKEEIIRRLVNINYAAVDEMTAGLLERWGDFSASSQTIRVSTQVPASELKRVLMHEIIHALSGQLENEYTSDDTEEENPVKKVEIIKSGIGFTKNINNSSHQWVEHLRWMNEALTEEISGSLIGEPQAYPLERQLLRFLIGESGIHQELFTQMYFENYTGQKEGHQLPKTQEFFQLINKKFGQGFLMNLDSFIKSRRIDKRSGLEVAIEMWADMGDSFPKYINDWSWKNNAVRRGIQILKNWKKE